MKYEQAVIEILKSLIISNVIPDYNSGAHTTRLITQAFEIADEYTAMLNEKLAKQTPPAK